MRLFRASRLPRAQFDPLDSSRSVARDGWRFNDGKTEILYAATVEALALLEVVVRPGWESVREITVASIDVPEGSVVDLDDVGISLPTNWNARPVARDSQSIGAELLRIIDTRARGAAEICGLRVPSVVSSTDFNVLLDPRQKTSYRVTHWARIPFATLRSTAT
ncbi:MAG: RES family NAD+ phosphorylase [Burkholderiaceae bacterium]|nr:RES family NAD+ phosphorylase [Burkholderiaceae bacterium]